MSYSKLSVYLKTNLRAPSVSFNWTDEDNKKFFDYIDENFPQDYLKKDKNLFEIKQAFKDYFEHVGYILFQIKHYQIRLKVFEYKIEPKESENVDAIIDIIDKYEEYIVENYRGKEDQIFIELELKDKIFDYIKTIKEENVNKKELVKYAIREAFELNDSDIVMLKKECIFIKKCDILKKNIIKSTEEKTIANRYNGIDEEELSSFNLEHFSSKEDRSFFNLAARLFVDRYLIEKNISNQDYEANVFGYVQSIITQQLIITYDRCEDFFKGLAGYVLRIHFQEVFEDIAEIILFEVAMSNKQIIEFLKYYSLDVVVVGGRKYRVPALEAENGLKWNVVSMLSIVKLYVKTNSAGKLVSNSIEKIEDEITLLCRDGLTPSEYNKKILEEKKVLTDELIKSDNILERYYDSLKFTKNESEKNTLQKEIGSLKKQMQGIREKRSKISNKSLLRSDVNKYLALEKEKDSLANVLKKEKRILGQNEEAFSSIKHALVKALISKKKKL